MRVIELQANLRRCQRCLEAGYEIQGPPVFSGKAGARLMLVGQAPGRFDGDNADKPFSGTAGSRLFQWLAQAGWPEAEFRSKFYMTSITKCFPGTNKSGRGDRAPSRAEISLCSDWLEAEVTLIDPEVILPVGSLAIARFLGSGRRLVDVIGQRFQIEGRIVIPLPHPSGASSWTQYPENRPLLAAALTHLATVRRELAL
ncbi:MAG: uracil-DNA glycosylase family protein [Caldilineales bacterium]|nr:uracil-DNA glycosylase family protein [Caldilineales bacterium]